MLLPMTMTDTVDHTCMTEKKNQERS